MRWLELRLPPLIVAVVFAGVMYAAALAIPGASFPLPARGAFAIALALLGALIALAGVVAFRRRGATVNPLTPGASTAIVSSGVYRFSRNPMYLGFLLALVGWAVYLSNVAAFMLLPLFIAYMNQYQIKPEERALGERFGSQFSQYTASVRRWI
ncbi:MAG: isoprenylcysteine carboxylmethyltransferase family protein [Proteobacteria bacterium]|nr:isoprenylcysteine carboxylmethyltransferase family protein [Pseudomonadota bacterium]